MSVDAQGAERVVASAVAEVRDLVYVLTLLALAGMWFAPALLLDHYGHPDLAAAATIGAIALPFLVKGARNRGYLSNQDFDKAALHGEVVDALDIDGGSPDAILPDRLHNAVDGSETRLVKIRYRPVSRFLAYYSEVPIYGALVAPHTATVVVDDGRDDGRDVEVGDRVTLDVDQLRLTSEVGDEVLGIDVPAYRVEDGRVEA
jgi:hypothetical protein